MNKSLKYALLATMILALLGVVACNSDDNSGNNPVVPPASDPWVGTWLSTGGDVAPILASLFSYDSVRVTMNDDNTVVLDTHPTGGAWTSLSGVYTVTESSGSDIDAIAINYTAFEQEGIIQVFTASPDSMYLEAVQTVPDIGAVPRTPADGFGSDPTLGTANLQKYRRQ